MILPTDLANGRCTFGGSAGFSLLMEVGSAMSSFAGMPQLEKEELDD